MRSRSAPKRLTLAQCVLLAVVVSYVGIVLLIPVGAIVVYALADGVQPLVDALHNTNVLHSLMLSFTLALIALVANGILGVGGALLLARHRFFGRRFLDALVDLPLAVSPVMTGLAFLLLFGRDGWFAPLLNAAGWKVTFAFPGLVIATLFVTFPFTIREVGHTLEELGTTEEEAAMTLGASPFATFWLVTLPNIRYGLGYGILLTTARALGEFGAVLVLGGAISGQTETATTFIYNALEERQDAAAYSMTLILVIASVLLLVGLEWMKRQRKKEV